MKQKIVIKVHMRRDMWRKKALGIAASAHGVQSVGIEGEDKDQLVVVGDGVDAINLTNCLRRKVGSAEIVTVGAVTNAEETTKPGKDAEWGPAGNYYDYYPWPAAGYCYEDGSHSCQRQDSWCSIL